MHNSIQDTSTKSQWIRFKLHYQHIWHFHHAQDTVPYKRPIYLASRRLPWRPHFTAAIPAQPWAEQEPHGAAYTAMPQPGHTAAPWHLPAHPAPHFKHFKHSSSPFFFFTAHKHMNIITALDTLTVHHPIITQHWQISQHYHKVV